jgi:hypothetical protein
MASAFPQVVAGVSVNVCAFTYISNPAHVPAISGITRSSRPTLLFAQPLLTCSIGPALGECFLRLALAFRGRKPGGLHSNDTTDTHRRAE